MRYMKWKMDIWLEGWMLPISDDFSTKYFFDKITFFELKAKKAGKGKTVKITALATDGTGKKAVVKIKIK